MPPSREQRAGQATFGARYDVGSGKMVRGPQGCVQATCGRRQGDYRRHTLEDVSGRAARRRNLAGRLTAGHWIPVGMLPL